MSRKLNPWKLATFLLMFLLGLIVWMGVTESRTDGKTIEAETFVLRDSGGNVRAEMWMKGDQPRIELYDRDGTTVWAATPNTADPGIVRRR